MQIAVSSLVTSGAGGFTVKIREADPVPPAFVAVRVMVEEPANVGVPEISPVLLLMLNPDGKPLAP